MVKHDKAKKRKSGKGKSGKGKAGKKSGKHADAAIPAVIVPETNAPTIRVNGNAFDLEDPVLPHWVDKGALGSGGYPYDDEMKTKTYDEELHDLQIELAKLQIAMNTSGRRMVALFEGRDAAGKGGTIISIRENMNPRSARIVALPKPTEKERGEWYFQRYVAELPTNGEIVLFDRSWYNRGGVEPIMGFCTDSETRIFLEQAPILEKMLVEEGILLFKFWLDIGHEMQLKRFHERRHNPLRVWKLSPIDYAALSKWDDYTRARDRMVEATDKPDTPWTIVLANDKRRAHLAVIRHVLDAIDYRGKNKAIVGEPDPAILGSARLLGA